MRQRQIKREKTCLKTQFENGVVLSVQVQCGWDGVDPRFPAELSDSRHSPWSPACGPGATLHLNERSRAAAARYVRVHPACAPPPVAGGATPPHTTSSARPESRSPRVRQSTWGASLITTPGGRSLEKYTRLSVRDK